MSPFFGFLPSSQLILGFVAASTVAGAPAEECHGGECGNSLLMSSALYGQSNAVLSEDRMATGGLASLHTLLGSVGTGEDTVDTELLGTLKDLTNNVISGKAEINDASKKLLITVAASMKKIRLQKLEEKNAEQALVNKFSTNISACGEPIDHQLGADNVDKKRGSHNACRALEKKNLTDAGDKCGKFASQEFSPPSCDGKFAGNPSDSIVDLWETNAKQMVVDATATKTLYHSMKHSCNNATALHTETKSLCNADQTEFEQAFCAYGENLTGTCVARVNCRTTHIEIQENVYTDVKELEKSNEIEYEIILKVMCYVRALNASATDMPDLAKSCQSLVVNTSLMKIDYPAIPEAGTCDSSSVAVKPCDSAWSEREYASQTAWYNFTAHDGTVLPQTTCVKCNYNTATPTTPASTPTATPASTAAPTSASTPLTRAKLVFLNGPGLLRPSQFELYDSAGTNVLLGQTEVTFSGSGELYQGTACLFDGQQYWKSPWCGYKNSQSPNYLEVDFATAAAEIKSAVVCQIDNTGYDSTKWTVTVKSADGQEVELGTYDAGHGENIGGKDKGDEFDTQCQTLTPSAPVSIPAA